MDGTGLLGKAIAVLVCLSNQSCGEIGDIWKKKGLANEPDSVFQVNSQKHCGVRLRNRSSKQTLELKTQCENVEQMLFSGQAKCSTTAQYEPLEALFPGRSKTLPLCQESLYKSFEGEDSLTVVVFGDTGAGQSFYQGYRQKSVAEQALLTCQQMGGCDFGVMLGDNFYPNGVSSVWDPKLTGYFEEFYNGFESLPFYAVLGNHDYHGNRLAQKEYSFFSSQWRMPDYHYGIQKLPSWLRMFGLDTQAVIGSDGASLTRKQQKEDLCEYLSSNDTSWKIVFGHFPAIGRGKYGGNRKLAGALSDYYSDCSFDLYLAGHEHNQEMVLTDLYAQVIQGGGGAALRPLRPTTGRQTAEQNVYGFSNWESLYAESSHGYTILKISKESLKILFFRVQSDEGALFLIENAYEENAAYRCEMTRAQSGCVAF